MRIGIDCRNILNANYGEQAGVGHYVYFLIKYLLQIDKENEYFLFFYNKNIKCPEFEQKNVKCVYFPGLENIGKIPFFYRHLLIPHVLRSYKLDVYHNPAFIIPLFYFKKSIITIHDLAMYKNPQWFPGGQFFNHKILIPLSIYRAKKIIAVSENTSDDLIKMFRVKKEKVATIHEGVEDYNQIIINENEIAGKFKIKDPYLLFIGTLEPRKNLVRLIEAFAEFLKESEQKNFKLVLAGKKGWKYEPIFAKIKELNLEGAVIYCGYVKLQEKIYLLKKAYAFVFPSLYEGFGLPILEAMNMGIPIVSSNIASIPELVIDNALLINPRDIDSIKKSLLKITSEPKLREKFISKGKGIVRNFSWEECAKKTLELYKNVK